ncbi:MAG TPA: nucleotidyltransferase domain-containing protein [Epsilonproteobacteria bacterium]|nr:nucleotidyltransferase domain-containing protein [Campylobacterota bacterium]
MRLSQEQIKVLKDRLKTISSTAKLYLFGSRVDDTKKGGDIDLLVVSKEMTKKDLRYLRIEFFKHFGEQKIDIVLDNGEFNNPFTKHIMKKAVLL